MVNTWGYFAGVVAGTPAGIGNWPNGVGSLTVTGTQGSTALTVNTVNVGSMSDYQVDSTSYPAGWAIVVLADDGTYRVYTVYAVNTSTKTLSLYPSLASSVTSQAAANLYDSAGSEHLTTLGYYGLADFVVGQTKGSSYLQAYASRYVSDGLGSYSGSVWTAIGGLNQGAQGNVPPTNCMTEGVFPYTSDVDTTICNAYSGLDRTFISGSRYQTLIGATVPGEGAKLTASLYGKSGYLDTLVGIEGQYQGEQAAARVQVYIDGSLVLNENFGGLKHIQVPFTHAQSGEIDVTVDSPYPCAPRISNTSWYVWNDADWNGVSPSDPLIPNGAKVLVLMDSWGTWHNAAFASRLAHDLPGSSITNVSQDGKTAAWAIANFSSLTAGGPYNYIISAFQINDLHPSTKGSLTDAMLLSNMETLWQLVLGTGATPIYLRSLSTDNLPEVQRLNEWDQSLTADYPIQTQVPQPQTITFPNPGTQTYGIPPIALMATVTSGLPVTYTVNSGPATVSGSLLTITGAGTVSVTANQAGNGGWLPAPPVTQFFTVNPAVLIVTANNQSMTYGSSVPSFTASYSGFVNGDGQGVLSGSPSLTTTATSSSPVGPYTITAALGTLSATNYSFVFANGTLTINPAVLTVTANNAGMIYGGTPPTLTYTMTGFVLGQNQGTATTGAPAESTTATSSSPVGVYTISISQGTLAATNYTFAFVNGNLTIGPATLTVTADNKSMSEGGSLPTFTASYSGFVNGDTQAVLSGSPSLTTDAPQNPPVGTYNIFAAQGTLGAANYTFAFVNGTLTVNTAVAQITAPPKNSMFSGDTVTFTWSHETNAVSYQLWLGTTPGAQDIASVTTSNLTTTISGLPTNGSQIYATLSGTVDGTTYTVQDTAIYIAYTIQGVITTPTPGSTFPGTTVTFNWVAGAGSSAYWLDVGSTPFGNDYYQSGNLGNVLTTTVNVLPSDGSTVYVTLWSFVGGVWENNTYTYTAYSNASLKGVITAPAPGSTLSGSSVAFTWSAGTQSTAYWLDIGNVAGGNQYYQSGNLGNVLTTTASGLPTDGSTVYVTLWSFVDGQWLNNQYTYTAYSAGQATGVITTPTPGSTFTGPTVTFDWTAGTGSSAYWLDIGNVPGGNQYYQSGNLGNVLTATVNNLPTDGSTVYVTLYSLVGSQWVANAYTYTAFSASNGLGVMQTPIPGSTLSGNIATFTWSAGSGATAYWLDIGSVPGGNQYYQSGNLGNVLTTTVYSLPADNSTIYVTLYSLVGGQWLSNAYTYTSGP
jgi:hypothetical protein